MSIADVQSLHAIATPPESSSRPNETRVELVLEAIHRRRSVSPRRLAPPGPSTREIQRIVDAASTAPDHCQLRPSRFVHILDASRGALSDAFEAALLERDADAPSPARNRARQKAYNGAVLLALVAHITPGHPDVPVSEQWVSVGAALQNALLAVEALGYRAMIVSGPVARSRAVRAAFDLARDEEMIGFIAIGTPGKPPKDRAVGVEDRRTTTKCHGDPPGSPLSGLYRPGALLPADVQISDIDAACGGVARGGRFTLPTLRDGRDTTRHHRAVVPRLESDLTFQ